MTKSFGFRTLILTACLVLGSPPLSHAYRLEFTAAGLARKYQGDSMGHALALRTHLSFGPRTGGLTFMGGAEWEYHPMAPNFVGTVGWRFGKNFFFEPAAGVFSGLLLGLGHSLLVVCTFGWEITNNFFVTVPIVFRTDLGPYRLQYLPYLGFYF